MKNKAAQKEMQKIDVLSKFLPLEKQSPSIKVDTFFNLLYSHKAPNMLLAESPNSFLSSLENPADIYEAYAILLSANMNNLDTFLKLNTFKDICAAFCKNIEQLSTKHYEALVKCLQASILQNLDSRASRQILKHIKVLRENGVISFHDEKCIQAAINISSKESSTKASESISNSVNSFLEINPNQSVFKEQINAIGRAKKVLSKLEWAKELIFLCEKDYIKNVLVIGEKKTGKSTLVATLLYDSKKSKHDKPLEAFSPITYKYGKGQAFIEYLDSQEIQKMTMNKNNVELPEEKSQKIKPDRIFQEIYESKKIEAVKHIEMYSESEILKYVNIINSPSLVPRAFRHLQLYESVIVSDVICCLVDIENMLAANMAKKYDYMLHILSRVIKQENIKHIYIICTHVDKVNLTIKKRETLQNKVISLVDGLLDSPDKKALLKKLHFNYVASSIAYNMRINNSSVMDSGFDLASSGILKLEEQLFDNIFNSNIKHYYIDLLKDIMQLVSEDKDDIEIDIKDLESMVSIVRKNATSMIEKLPARYSSFYSSFANLRDNLYSHFIQSLNYEMRRRSGFNIKKLKQSTIDSIFVGLQGLSDILQSHFLNHKELQIITKYLGMGEDSIFKYAKTNKHKSILNHIATQFNRIVKEGYPTYSNNIVAEHLSYRLDIILPDNSKKESINEEDIINPLKEAFEYYFLLLECNIEKLFNERIHIFETFIKDSLQIIESSFIEYYKKHDNKIDCVNIIKHL